MAISWELGAVSYTISEDQRTVELIVPNVGRSAGTQLYTISENVQEGPGDWREWVVVSVTPSAYAESTELVTVVIETSFFTETFEPYDTFYRVETWLAPPNARRFPAHLAGLGALDVERWLFREVAARTEIYGVHGRGAWHDVPTVPVSKVEGAIVVLMWTAAQSIAERGGMLVEQEPVAAVRVYEESEPAENMNETIACYWTWRLAYRVELAGTTGFLTIKARAFHVDAHEKDGVDNIVESSIEAWLDLPASEARVGALEPGVLLASPKCELPRPKSWGGSSSTT